MSEPMSKMEIEDVLSSIRRLVTEDVRQRPSRPGLLVLTPALRVPEDELEQQFSESPQPEAEAETGADEPASAEAEEPFEPEDFAEPEDLTELEDFAEPEDLTAPEAAAVPELAPAVSIEDRIAELEAAIGASDEEFEPDGSEGEAEPSLAESLLRQTRGHVGAQDSAAPPAGPDTATPAAAMAAPGAADGDDGAEAEDLDFVDWDTELQDTAPAGPARTEAASPMGAASRTARPLAEAAETGLEEALIDEDALREIVADLVREQLRGELGERITRNVRRLIRREIHRALALKELAEDDDI